MPGSDEPTPADPPPLDPDLLRRRERLDVLVRIGFWTTASSVVLVMPMCLGCGFLMPAWAAPLVFLPAPILFILGGLVFITAQVLANRVNACEVCAAWAEASAFSDPHSLRQCPQCGRWAGPGSTRAWNEEGREQGHGFPVIMPGDKRDNGSDQEIHIPGSREG
jgi:hypothetical protein